MTSNQAQVSSNPVTSPSFSPDLRYSTCCDTELETNKQSTMSSNPVQEHPHPTTSRRSSSGLQYSTDCDAEPDASNLQQEVTSIGGIPVHSLSPPPPLPTSLTVTVLSPLQKYFLTTIPSPGKIISINLVPEASPAPSSPSDISSLLEEIAIPDHGKSSPTQFRRSVTDYLAKSGCRCRSTF
jgi:hypothetical protein